jgi:hypothetical protein
MARVLERLSMALCVSEDANVNERKKGSVREEYKRD